MQLSGRLLALADLVSADHILADVGCDHGYVPIYLVQQGIIPRAIALDVAEGPLARASAHIESCGLSAVIETRLSDGLTALAPGEADSILMAGMGGKLMENILTKGNETAKTAAELILQPQSDIPHLRVYLYQHGYAIRQENMIVEDGKYYTMMIALPGQASYTDLECRYGPCLIREQNPVLGRYLAWEQAHLASLVRHLEDIEGLRAQTRRQEIRTQLNLNRKAREIYDK